VPGFAPKALRCREFEGRSSSGGREAAVSKTRPDDCVEDVDRNGEPMRSGVGSGSGKTAPPPATSERSAPSKEVTTIPIGTPDTEEVFRQRNERARPPQPADADVNVGSDQEE
jgi:hypothetical protein